MRAARLLSLPLALVATNVSAELPKNAARAVDIKTPDGTVLNASYFAAKPGPGVLLFHQSNRTRESWNELAQQLAAAGMNVLTVDSRGYGESGGKYDGKKMSDDVSAAFDCLVSQPGVNRETIGAGGAGWLGVTASVEAARRHPDQVKSLVLMSGETLRDGLQFLHKASQLPELFVFSDEDEYPPTQDAMKLLYVTASSSSKELVHYTAAENAPWRWYETADAGKVPAHGGHGTDMFKTHPELPGIIVQRFQTTLIKTPGHAPADTLAAASLLNQLQAPGGAVQVKQQLLEARRVDPQAQLFPEISASITGQDFMRDGDAKSAIEVFQLILIAYPDSADDNDNLATAYLKDGQKDLARQHARKVLAILDAHAGPASSWTDTDEYRGEIRSDAEKILKQLTELK
ncbi:MAG: alpha/beta fold hydrolase [Chthoniobacterales bacterium]